MKRFQLALKDLRAQLRLFFAEISADGAQRALDEAAREYDRATGTALTAAAELKHAQDDADRAAKHVLAYRQTAPVRAS